MSDYEPELGQAIFGNPTGGYEMSDAGCKAFARLISAIEDIRPHWDCYEDPAVPGITFRGYYWGDDESKAALPNLVIDKVPHIEIRWYKHPGRGMSVNMVVSDAEWEAWLEIGLEGLK